ncbi:MAG: 50S ribosomal protein L18 [Clostridium sp. CAG_433_25_7]|nr:MAG: 50S ribosomal protein L18 [Clostridium sp. CAG_433_25_7]
MMKKVSRNEARQARHERIRKNISGTNEVPRLNVFRSAKHITAQIIDDDKDLKIENGGNVEAAKKVGEAIAKKAVKAGITKVVFDRGGYLYHGRVQAFADAARENGLEF